MWRIGVMILSLIMFTAPLKAQENPAPYMYYYSDALNAFVIERADGTDSRMIGKGVTSPEADRIYGAGWSPDGKWLGWVAYTWPDDESGYIISADDQHRVDIFNSLSRIFNMQWSPEGNLLFVTGYAMFCSDDCPITYWLVDVENERVLASFTIPLAPMGAGSTPFEWSLEDHNVTFYAVEYTAVNQYYRITMHFDGTVIKQPFYTLNHVQLRIFSVLNDLQTV